MAHKTGYSNRMDMLSMGASLLCALHCVALPIFFSTLPLLGVELMENPWLEAFTILISLVAGGWAIWRAYWYNHRIMWIPLLFLMGIVCMVSGNFLHNEWVEMATKAAGAVVLVTAHIFNWKKALDGGHNHEEDSV